MRYEFSMFVDVQDTAALLSEARRVAALEGVPDCDDMLLDGGEVNVENCLVMIFDRTAFGCSIIESSATPVALLSCEFGEDEFSDSEIAESEEANRQIDQPLGQQVQPENTSATTARDVVNAFLERAHGWNIHESHYQGMRDANTDDQLKEAVKVFLQRIDTVGWAIHPSHLVGLRALITQY